MSLAAAGSRNHLFISPDRVLIASSLSRRAREGKGNGSVVNCSMDRRRENHCSKCISTEEELERERERESVDKSQMSQAQISKKEKKFNLPPAVKTSVKMYKEEDKLLHDILLIPSFLILLEFASDPFILSFRF